MFDRQILNRRLLRICLLAAPLALVGCDGKIDSPSDDGGGGSGGGGSGETVNGIPLSSVALRSEGTGVAVNPPQPIVSMMLRAETGAGEPVSGLTQEHVLICEGPANGTLEPISDNSESFAEIASRDELPYSLKTVLVLDVSTSISPADFSAMQTAAKALVAKIEPQQQIAIHSFSGTVQIVQPFTSNLNLLNDAIDRLRLVGNSTNLYGAAINAFEQWTPSYTQESVSDGYAILVTDGEHNADATSISAVETARGSGDSMKRMFVIGVGDGANSSVLERIAGDSRRVVTLSNFSGLDEALQDALSEMQDYANSFYFLRYASTRRSGEYQVKAVVNRSGASCASAGISGTYSATGFQELAPELQFSGPAYVLPGQSIEWGAKLKWAPFDSSFRFTSSDVSVATVAADVASGKSAKVTIHGTAQYQGEAVISVSDTAYGLSDSGTITVGGLFLDNFGDNNEELLAVGRQRILSVRTPGATSTPDYRWEVVSGTAISLSSSSGSQITISGLQLGDVTLRISDLNNDRQREILVRVL